MVSDTHKSIVDNEIQGLPVESVSSFPLRINHLAKFKSVQPDILTGEYAGVLPVMDSVSKCSDEKSTVGVRCPGLLW